MLQVIPIPEEEHAEELIREISLMKACLDQAMPGYEMAMLLSSLPIITAGVVQRAYSAIYRNRTRRGETLQAGSRCDVLNVLATGASVHLLRVCTRRVDRFDHSQIWEI